MEEQWLTKRWLLIIKGFYNFVVFFFFFQMPIKILKIKRSDRNYYIKNFRSCIFWFILVLGFRYTVPMRDKEIETDYRFMPEPNLPAVKLDKRWIAEARSSIVKPQFLHYIENFGMDPDAALRIAVIIFLHVISNFVHKFKYMLQIYVYRFIQLKTRQLFG